MNKKTINLTPQPYVTRTHQGRFSKRAHEYHDYCNQLRALAGSYRLPPAFSVTFFMPIPKSTPKARKQDMIGKAHQKKPDTSNLLKAVEDSLHSGSGDSYIWNTHALKVYSNRPRIEITEIKSE